MEDVEKLFIFELANNHMGDIEHGLRIINSLAAIADKYPQFNYAIKFQMRHIPTFIHPKYLTRDDIDYVRRFKETALSYSDYHTLITEVENLGFKTICTGFDETSVEIIEEMGFEVIKIASCSLTDWPLLNKIAETSLPIIASTGGATMDDITKVVHFFYVNRRKNLTLMHCVGEYPTKEQNLQLYQIPNLRAAFPGVRIGFSTHEDPSKTDIVQVAMGLGAEVFEKHVGISTDAYPLNKYSADMEQVEAWLAAAATAEIYMGQPCGRLPASNKELADLRRFRRGVFANRDIQKGENIHREDVYYAFPCVDDQVLANDMSKYTKFVAHTDYKKDAPIMCDTTGITPMREEIFNIVQTVKEFLGKTGVRWIPTGSKLEISHHYGIEDFYFRGLTMVTILNRDYCKKLLILLPHQYHPQQYHKQKEETFTILHGGITLTLDGESQDLKVGDMVTIPPGVKHEFGSFGGAVIEELSTTHIPGDSYYTDPDIMENKDRKTIVTYW